MMVKKKILYAAIKYPYADPNQGLSYEYYQFLDSLRQIKDLKVEEFDWVGITAEVGRDEMNRRLLRRVEIFKPDVVFFSLFKDEFKAKTIEQIGEKTITLNWFADDANRFDDLVTVWAPRFSWVISVTPDLISRYWQIGQKNVIQSQFGANPRIYTKGGGRQKKQVGFVGQAHSNRRRLLWELEKAGIPLCVAGKGWERGVVGIEELVKVIHESAVNINLSGSSFGYQWKRFLPRWLQTPTVWPAGERTIVNGRLFEVPMCGGFLLTGPAMHLEDYFVPGKELVVFHSAEEMIELARFYLSHDTERKKIAAAGYRRAVMEHTYTKRFRTIFKQMGILE